VIAFDVGHISDKRDKILITYWASLVKSHEYVQLLFFLAVP